MSDETDPNASRVERLRVLGVKVDELRSGEVWQRWLEIAAKFHTYSASNTLLILRQRPDATHVAGYRRWQTLGRQVRRGEKGITIMAPRTRKDPNDPDRRILTGFGTAKVFDISQTDGEPVKPEWPLIDHPFDQSELDILVAKADAAGIPVEFTEEERQARGWFLINERRIVVRAGLPVAQQAKTLLHELGHAFDAELRSGCSRASEEIVAESVSWLLSTRFGLDADPVSTSYLASWDGGEVELMRLADRIITTTRAVEREVLDLDPFLVTAEVA